MKQEMGSRNQIRERDERAGEIERLAALSELKPVWSSHSRVGFPQSRRGDYPILPIEGAQ